MAVLYFTANWCAPCKAFKPVVQQTSAELSVPVNFIDVDSNGPMAQQYGVNNVPTLIVVDPITQKIIKRHSGAMSKPALVQFLSGAR